jgi:hypothetical protein
MVFLFLPVVDPDLQHHITTAHLGAYFHGIYHAIFKYYCIAIGLVHHVANVPGLDTASGVEDGGGESSVEVRAGMS